MIDGHPEMESAWIAGGGSGHPFKSLRQSEASREPARAAGKEFHTYNAATH